MPCLHSTNIGDTAGRQVACGNTTSHDSLDCRKPSWCRALCKSSIPQDLAGSFATHAGCVVYIPMWPIRSLSYTSATAGKVAPYAQLDACSAST